jgi:K+-transporting ATPase ATPase C chain
VANAEIQVARVAKARVLSEDRVRELVKQNTSGRDLGVFGEPRVNVMTLNFELDAQKLVGAQIKPGQLSFFDQLPRF